MEVDLQEFDIILVKFYFSDLKSYKNRPVIIIKKNLPFDDMLVVAISSQIQNLFNDEIIIDTTSLQNGELPKTSKVMLRKTLVIEKSIVVKKYGSLNENKIKQIKQSLCRFYDC
jgi:mRNA interferase MazF